MPMAFKVKQPYRETERERERERARERARDLSPSNSKASRQCCSGAAIPKGLGDFQALLPWLPKLLPQNQLRAEQEKNSQIYSWKETNLHINKTFLFWWNSLAILPNTINHDPAGPRGSYFIHWIRFLTIKGNVGKVTYWKGTDKFFLKSPIWIFICKGLYSPTDFKQWFFFLNFLVPLIELSINGQTYCIISHFYYGCLSFNQHLSGMRRFQQAVRSQTLHKHMMMPKTGRYRIIFSVRHSGHDYIPSGSGG